MGSFVNPSNVNFAAYARLDRYVDKSPMLELLNGFNEDPTPKFVCVTRPRRFGKSVTAAMITAYYSRGADSKSIFDALAIAKSPTYAEHLNRHNVIAIDIQYLFKNAGCDVGSMLVDLERSVLRELQSAGFGFDFSSYTQLAPALRDFEAETHEHFIFVIDEWDCIFRERKEDETQIRDYLNYLVALFKEQPYVSLVYMTGILPIKKYGTHSALNMFDEYSMTDPGCFAEYVGFTSQEVAALCTKFSMDLASMRLRYDGYSLEGCPHIYNPNSVIKAVSQRKFANFWTKTETFEALQEYISLNLDGLYDAVLKLMAGEEMQIDPTVFKNDMTSLSSRNDVLTLLVHLGYLAVRTEKIGVQNHKYWVRIPNEEIREEFASTVSDSAKFKPLAEAIVRSELLLEDIWNGNSAAVAAGFDAVHQEATSVLDYNSESDLTATVTLGLYSSISYYTLVREMPAGKGFADLVYIPQPGVDKPALIVELKYNHSAQSAIDQIRERNYPSALKAYFGNMLLVGISYDKKSKQHECVIERVVKSS